MNIESEKLVLHSGKAVSAAPGNKAPKSYLTRAEMAAIHLMPTADPLCFIKNEDGSLTFCFSPDNVTVSPAEMWYSNDDSGHKSSYTLPDSSVIPFIDFESAEALGLHTAKYLHELHLTIVEAPCAFFVESSQAFDRDYDEEETYQPNQNHKNIESDYDEAHIESDINEERENKHLFPDRDGDIVFLYDIRTCKKNPLMCMRCGKDVRFKNKLCRSCYEKDMLIRRKSGDAYRASVKGTDRGKAIFFDLELTGVYPYDEIISVSITDGYGNEIMDTLVKPERRKQWKETVKIHKITPEMTQSAPYLRELVPKIKKILLSAEIIVAYGISTDYTHIKKIFTEKEQKILEKKLRCCAKEYVRYISEYEPDINRSALTTAMEYFGIDWTGCAHTSMADTHACRFVWEKIFPNCYIQPADEINKNTEIIKALEEMPFTRSVSFSEGEELAKRKKYGERLAVSERRLVSAQSCELEESSINSPACASVSTDNISGQFNVSNNFNNIQSSNVKKSEESKKKGGFLSFFKTKKAVEK